MPQISGFRDCYTVKMKHLLIISLIVVWALYKPTPVLATRSVIIDFTVVTSDGQYVFVMLIPKYPDSQLSEIAQKYPQSGLYRNDGSTMPLWTVDWYSSLVFVSSDGIHLAAFTSCLCEGVYSRPALVFYEQGRMFSAHCPSLKNDWLYFLLLPDQLNFWAKSITFDDKTDILVVETRDSDKLTFNIATGQILEWSSPLLTLADVYMFTPIGLFIFAFLWKRKGKIINNPTNLPTTRWL